VPDVVIAGYGPAGAAAAIAAHDAGRSVLVLESADRGGGNARYSGGFLFDVPGEAARGTTSGPGCSGRTAGPSAASTRPGRSAWPGGT